MDQKLQRGKTASRPLVFRQDADPNMPGRHPHCEGKNDRCLTTISSEPATSKKAPSVRSSTSYYSYLWVPQLYFLHVSSDLLIGLSYVAISTTLIYLIYRARRDIPFSLVFLAFGVFIIACSATHFMEVWTIWHATYWLSGYVKLLTAAASVTTAVVLPFLVPKVLMLIQAVKLSEERRAHN